MILQIAINLTFFVNLNLNLPEKNHKLSMYFLRWKKYWTQINWNLKSNNKLNCNDNNNRRKSRLIYYDCGLVEWDTSVYVLNEKHLKEYKLFHSNKNYIFQLNKFVTMWLVIMGSTWIKILLFFSWLNLSHLERSIVLCPFV